MANPVPLPAPELRRTGTSLHRQVYLVLRDRLLTGALRAREQLPPEPVLCEQFGVSRITLRRAVADLVEEGLLERVQGRGTFVTARLQDVEPRRRSEGYVDDVRRISAETTVRVVEYGQVPAPHWVAARLGLDVGEPVLRTVRVRLRQGTPVVLLTAWVPHPWADAIGKAELGRRPLNELLAAAGVRFGRVLQEISAAPADPLQAQRLQLGVGSALLVVDRTVHDQDGSPVEFVSMVLSPERSRFIIDTPAEQAQHVSTGRVVHLAAHAAAAAQAGKVRRRG